MYTNTDFVAAAAPAVQDQLATTRPLEDLLAEAGGLSRAEKETIIDQASWLLEQAYVHLPQKRAMHVVDPLQQLRLLRYQLDALPDDLAFHREMAAIFTGLRDLHTNYLLPPPFRDAVAYLPFMVEEFYDGDEPHYLVSKLLPGFTAPPFGEEVLMLDWNGVPIRRALARFAERQAGGNPAARAARSLEALTIRPLVRSLPPDETWVVIGYQTADGQRHELRQDWLVFQPSAAMPEEDARAGAGLALGLDLQGERIRETRKVFFAPRAVEAAQQVAARNTPQAPSVGSLETSLPTVFRAEERELPGGPFGYIRIFTFVAPNGDIDGFVGEFARLATVLPQRGLIIDVRGNGGGHIHAAERLLQLLTPHPIEPAGFQLINSPLTLALCRRFEDLQIWEPSIAQAVETGAPYSLSFPLTDRRTANADGQRYPGPVVLITDATCYSATDMFAAGFRDHQIGPILGTSGNTGAGGANVWPYRFLRELASLTGLGPLPELPGGVDMRVAIRRSLRVGVSSGVLLEDLGVTPDRLHRMTRRDLLQGNADLLEVAAQLLVAQPVHRLELRVVAKTARRIELALRGEGVDRVDVQVGGRPVHSLDVADDEVLVRIPLRRGTPARLRLHCWQGERLVISLPVGD
jgi:hypothetical protein